MQGDRWKSVILEVFLPNKVSKKRGKQNLGILHQYLSNLLTLIFNRISVKSKPNITNIKPNSSNHFKQLQHPQQFHPQLVDLLLPQQQLSQQEVELQLPR